jgi:regulator of replication initiation timing
MATNAELTELEKQVSELRAELATLRSVLEKVFRELGASAMWFQALRSTQQVPVQEIAATINEAAPAPVSVVPTKADLERMSQELFGRPLLTTNEIQEVIAASTAKG